jgi:urease
MLPRELDKLVITQVGSIAQERLGRGLRLNHVEANGLISKVLLEMIRSGEFSVAQMMNLGRKILGFKHVLPGVIYTLKTVQVEGTFKDGTKLVSIHSPISDVNDLTLAFYGTSIKAEEDYFSNQEDGNYVVPGEIIPSIADIVLFPSRIRTSLQVTNFGDRPVQVGSHYHFFEVNPWLEFNRLHAYGRKLDIPGMLSFSDFSWDLDKI